MWILFLISDLLYFVLKYIVRYRRKVIYKNLINSFPDKTENEIEKIADRYYRNLADIFVEVIKLRHMSEKQLSKRVVVKNREVLDRYYKSEKKVIAAVAHIGNWEWVATISPYLLDHIINLVYKPLSDKFFNDFLLKLRSKSGLKFIPFKQTYRYLIKNKHELSLTVLASDQTPTSTEIEYWTTFLNQETGFFNGLERMAKSLDCAVIFVETIRVRRGYYEVNFIDITGNPIETAEHEIMDKYISLLENHINKYPDNWLWSHKRWKHKNNEQ
jgi:KDO2-lipid IV(A) lauroyltransferase